MTSSLIAFAGMTHLGLVSATAAAEKGFPIICFDPDERRIETLKQDCPFVEPMLPELMKKNSHHLHFTSDFSVLKKCTLVYIAIDVPTDETGQSSLASVEKLINQVSQAVGNETILIILSQVPPGFTRKIAFDPFRLFYQVETLIFGQAIERALKPERFIIGAFDPEKLLPPPFADFLQTFGCPILPMRYESAELSKIAINMFLVSSVSTSNTIAELCERIGADWNEMIPSLKLDKRIGAHAYLNAGLGLSGGNLERDLATFCHLSEEKGTDNVIVRAWLRNSHHMRDWALRKIRENVFPLQKNPQIALLGLSYKKNTSSIKNSPSIALLHHLRNFSVKAFDPAVKALPDCYPNLEVCQSALEACSEVDTLLIMTPWDEFRKISLPATLKTVIDPFGLLAYERLNGINYFRLGAHELIQTHS